MSSSNHNDPLGQTSWRLPAWLWAALAIAGLAGWVISIAVMHADAPRVWRALLISFLFFAPLSAGMVVWSAVVVASRGRWAGSLEQLA